MGNVIFVTFINLFFQCWLSENSSSMLIFRTTIAYRVTEKENAARMGNVSTAIPKIRSRNAVIVAGKICEFRSWCGSGREANQNQRVQ